MSSTGQITPRSVLHYRPLSVDMPEVAPWIRRASRTFTRPLLPQRHVQVRRKQAGIVLSWETTIGVSMAVTLLVIVFGQALAGWGTTLYDNFAYGTPRTFQVNAVVGHEGTSHQPSHFIALNNQGHVEIIEFPGNDASHARIYFGPLLTGTHADQVPVTLRFIDPGHTHKPNMLVQVQSESILFINRDGTFQLASG